MNTTTLRLNQPLEPAPARHPASASFYTDTPHVNDTFNASSTPHDGTIHTVSSVAHLLNLHPQTSQNKTEWHGANPSGEGATKDGFILFAKGNAYDRSLGQKYNSTQVAELAGIPPAQYEPCAQYRTKYPSNTINRSAFSSPKFPQHQQNYRQSSQQPSSQQLSSQQQSSQLNSTHKPTANKNTTNKSTRAQPKAGKSAFDWNRAQLYNYEDIEGTLILQVGRIDHPNGRKEIRQRSPRDNGGWNYKLEDGLRPLYNLRDVLQAETILIAEGEKVTDQLNADLRGRGCYGAIVATTSSQGSSSFSKTDATPLYNKDVVILPDNDVPGAKYRDAILEALSEPCSLRQCSLKVIDLPERGEGGDYIDFRGAGRTIDEVIELIKRTPQWHPPQPKPDFETFTLADMEVMPTPPWLIRGILQVSTTSVLSADSGSFKSFIALDMALSVATGRAFHEREVKSGTVVYVAAEGFYTMKERAQAWSLHHRCPLPQNIHFLATPLEVLNPQVIEKFVAQISQLKPVLLVLDTLSQCTAGANENDNGAMALFVQAMMGLAGRLDAHVLTLHHNAKSSGLMRGATSIKANIDTAISLERSENKQDNVVRVRCEKQRGKPFENFELRGFEVTTSLQDEYGDPVTSLVFEENEGSGTESMENQNHDRVSPLQEQLLKVFDACAVEAENFGGGVKAGSWLAAVENCQPPLCKRSAFYNHLNVMKKKGIIEQYAVTGSSPLYRRTLSIPNHGTPSSSMHTNPSFISSISASPSSPSVPSSPSRNPINSGNNLSIQSNNPLGVGLDGQPEPVTPNKRSPLNPKRLNPKPPNPKQYIIDSEPYQRPLANQGLRT